MMWSAATILTVLAAVFALLVVMRLARQRGQWDAASRTWTLIAIIFAIVSLIVSG